MVPQDTSPGLLTPVTSARHGRTFPSERAGHRESPGGLFRVGDHLALPFPAGATEHVDQDYWLPSVWAGTSRGPCGSLPTPGTTV